MRHSPLSKCLMLPTTPPTTLLPISLRLFRYGGFGGFQAGMTMVPMMLPNGQVAYVMASAPGGGGGGGGPAVMSHRQPPPPLDPPPSGSGGPVRRVALPRGVHTG